MKRSYGSDSERAELAIEMVLPVFMLCARNRLFKRGHVHITVSRVSRSSPDHFIHLAERSEGSNWEHDYKSIAEGKRNIVARTGMTTREVVEQHPALLNEGEPRWAGGVIVDDIIVAVSGLEDEFDEMLASMVAHAVIALRYYYHREKS